MRLTRDLGPSKTPHLPGEYYQAAMNGRLHRRKGQAPQQQKGKEGDKKLKAKPVGVEKKKKGPFGTEL